MNSVTVSYILVVSLNLTVLGGIMSLIYMGGFKALPQSALLAAIIVGVLVNTNIGIYNNFHNIVMFFNALL